jgi:hypothetical protein
MLQMESSDVKQQATDTSLLRQTGAPEALKKQVNRERRSLPANPLKMPGR